MKNLIKLTFIIALLSGCDSMISDPYRFCDGVVIDKETNNDLFLIKIRHKETINKVYVVEFDFNNLQLGDTLKCDTK